VIERFILFVSVASRWNCYACFSADGTLPTVNPSSLGVPQNVMQQNVNVAGRPNNVLPPNPYQQQQEFSSPDLLPLPAGWDRATSPEGEVYYIDHNTKTTSWTHPGDEFLRIDEF
jgi:WW domain